MAEFNPKSELPDEFQYVDLESVVGTELISHRLELKKSAPSRAQRLASYGDIFYQTVRPYQKNNYLFLQSDINFVFSTGYAQMRPFIDAEFLFSFLQTEKFVNIVLDNCTGTSYPAINTKDLSNIFIKLPSLLDEQKEIGRYLSKMDRFIIHHNQKLDNLVKLKKSLLQKMFPKKGEKVPKLRFPGFSGDWEERKLGEIGSTYTGLTGKTKEDFGHGDAKFITFMNVFSNSIIDLNMTESVEIDNKQNQVQAGDVLFTTSSETPEEVGMTSVIVDTIPNLYLNSFCFGYRPSITINHNYLANYLRSEVFRKEIIFSCARYFKI